jgi:general secretion pathway protein D
MNDKQDLGIEWRLPNFKNDFAGGTNFPDNADGGLINGATAVAQKASERLLKTLPLSGVTVGFLRGGDLRAVLHALQQDTNTNIVSTPSLVAMDNETAEIVVADKIPFKTADSTSTTVADAPIRSTFDYRDVGLKLNITPMITKGDAVKLTLEQTTGSVKSAATDTTPTTAQRTIKTVVVVNNKDILVLGGLIQTQRDAGESKVPILGDIPLIGNLFKRSTNGISKKNLMVFIRPVVLRNNEESNNVSLSKYDYMRDDQLLYKVDPYSRIAKQMMPQLPDLDKKASKKKLNLPDPYNSGSYITDLADSIG